MLLAPHFSKKWSRNLSIMQSVLVKASRAKSKLQNEATFGRNKVELLGAAIVDNLPLTDKSTLLQETTVSLCNDLNNHNLVITSQEHGSTLPFV